MSERNLNVGAIVHLAGPTRSGGLDAPAYRIEQLLDRGDGATLYKIKSEAEPFERIVSARSLTMRA